MCHGAVWYSRKLRLLTWMTLIIFLNSNQVVCVPTTKKRWELVKAKWENALTADSSSSFLVQSQVFVPQWPFYPISTFYLLFLLEPLTPFQDHYDRLFADVWNRKIENILNCNFTFAILGQGNWAGLLRVIYQTCANNTKCCWLVDAGVGNVLPNTGGSKLESVICSFAFVHFSLLPVFNSNVCLGAALLASLSLPWTRH